MAEYIECRKCDSPYCDGCNTLTLSKMLHARKFDCLLDEHHCINPCADVVPVVRCGECKYFHNLTCKIRKGSWGEQLKVGFTDFCSDGERRADNG